MTEDFENKLGFSGRVAAYFENSQLTPLLALIALLSGIFAFLITPREEEPQINVTMANIFIPFPGASVGDVENLVTSPMEQILAEINDVDHIYSVSRPGMSVVTIQYKVGVPRTEALVRLYNAIYSNQDWRPQNSGILSPLVKPKGIDDVPIVTLTLMSNNPTRGAFDLKQIAHALEIELKRIPGTRNINTIGGPEQIVRVVLDAQKLAARGISVSELRQALLSSNSTLHATGLIDDNAYIPVQAGEFFSNRDSLADLIVGLHDGKPIYLQDVAHIEYGPAENESYVWYANASNHQGYEMIPAVTLAISKKPGENAITIANKIIEKVEKLKGAFIPEDVEVVVTRNYGTTADEKASKLIEKLFFATVSVIALVLFTLGWREAIVVGSAVILTLSATLFASWAWGFTINRVSLFALILSIGILVDDAIVIVENIHRHLSFNHSNKSFSKLIIIAVNEVGGPTILATFTVIAALMPMAFVSGLMGPYMSPIPINASMGMLISLSVALGFTPWLSNKIIKHNPASESQKDQSSQRLNRSLESFFRKIMMPFLGGAGRYNRYWLAAGIMALILLAISLVLFKVVILKMLPFDNKSEFQVVVDMPEGVSVERTNAALAALADYLVTVPEIVNIQAYAGTASPIGFNGLVRQYYLRQSPNRGDIQVNLKDKHERKQSSHEIATAVRPKLNEIGKRYDMKIKVVEVPPGPPVQAPLMAEIYGPDYQGQISKAKEILTEFEKTPGMVDIDDSVEARAPRFILSVNRQKAALLGVSQEEVTTTIAAALGGLDVTFIHTGHAKYPIPVRIELPIAEKASIDSILALYVKGLSGKLVPMSEIVTVHQSQWENSISHKDLLPVVYVTGDMAGKIDSPLYGMIAMLDKLKKDITQYFIRQPENTYNYSVKWDGEWQITYETFRDMGLAYSVGLILIYLLVVGQFHSYAVPLVIMSPIPLTLIGILPGHALLGAQFTATSMIGMIALAGIIVRNSILLVDFINKSLLEGASLENAVIQASSVRAKPIILTALAAMLGAFFILDDPVFNGLAVSLISGMFASTLLTLLIIPVFYYCIILRQKTKKP
jgi:multidrug efflux pump subunit AcrB